MSADCNYSFRQHRKPHTCILVAGHEGPHRCGECGVTEKKDDAADADAAFERTVDAAFERTVDDETALQYTHIEDKTKQPGYGVSVARCGARRQQLIKNGTIRGVTFATPDKATCPLCLEVL